MKYLIGTAEEIKAINEQEAADRGCSGVTTEWYATRMTASGETCLLIDDDKEIAGASNVEPIWLDN